MPSHLHLVSEFELRHGACEFRLELKPALQPSSPAMADCICRCRIQHNCYSPACTPGNFLQPREQLGLGKLFGPYPYILRKILGIYGAWKSSLDGTAFSLMIRRLELSYSFVRIGRPPSPLSEGYASRMLCESHVPFLREYFGESVLKYAEDKGIPLDEKEFGF
jgi:hypothetical protein